MQEARQRKLDHARQGARSRNTGQLDQATQQARRKKPDQATHEAKPGNTGSQTKHMCIYIVVGGFRDSLYVHIYIYMYIHT